MKEKFEAIGSNQHARKFITEKKYLKLASKRFWTKVKKTKTCWIWLGCKVHAGYGRFNLNGKQRAAHAVSLILNGKNIPFLKERMRADIKCVDHICRNPACVNPKHLRVVTFYENVMFGNSPSAINKRKSHCNNGHLLSGKNIYFRVSGKNRDRKSRVCRACENNAKRIKRAALRALKV